MIPIFGNENRTCGLSVKTNFFNEKKFSSDNLLVHLLQGEVKVTAGEHTHLLLTNEMMMISGNTHITWESKREDTYLLIYTISTHLLNTYIEMTSNIIKTSVIDERMRDFNLLETTSKSIVLSLRQNDNQMDFHSRSLASELLYLISKNMLVKRKVKRNSDSRIFEALLYIETNYKNVISLDDIADYFKVSSGYFSRYFKKQTGSSFLKYLNDYRLEKAAEKLSNSSDKISAIANQTGFANINSFNKKFRLKFGISPKKYRENYDYRKDTIQINKELSEVNVIPSSILKNANKREVEIGKIENFIVNNQPWKKIINMGSAEDLLQYDLRNHLKLVKKDLDIEYIRFWNLFTKGMNIDPTMTDSYNFEKIDSVIDFLLAEGLKPFIELRYKIRRIHGSTKKTLVFENEDFKYSLNSSEWFDMVEKFIKHVNNRYGKKIVNEWMLEFSFEHYQGESELKELISHYKKTYEIIKKHNSLLKIGGPGAPAQNSEMYNFGEDLLYFQKEYVEFDFISYTIFPYQVGSDGEKNSQRIEREKFLVDTVDEIHAVVKNTHYQGTEIIITEWNNTISNRNAINDSLYKGSYLIKNFSTIIDKLDGIAYWVGSDLFSEFVDSKDILHGGSGLIAKGSLLKPAFHAYKFMEFLREKVILNVDGLIVSYNEETDEYGMILYNYQEPNLEYYLIPEDEIFVEDINHFFYERDPLEFQISLLMEPSKKFELKTFRVNNEFGNIISGWKDIGLRSSLRNKDTDYLKLKADPQIKFKQLYSNVNGNLLIEEVLESNEFIYISVSPIYE